MNDHLTILLEAVRKYWGYDSFRPLQQESALAVMEARDSLTVLPTGGGKSLCYQAPAMCRDGMAVVVSPLIALMKDQVDGLVECGIPAAFVNSSLSVEQRRDVASRVRSGDVKLLFVAPERLVQNRTLDFLNQTKISFVAIDEAHCISNWGHDFRPEYRQLRRLRKELPGVSIHAYTATATEAVRSDIVEQLQLQEPEVLVGSFDRPNLTYRVERRDDQMAQVCAVIDRHPNESGIIYCISRANVETMAAALKAQGYRSIAYHAGLNADERQAAQEAFIDEKIDIIVATVAFGMGIDKSNVRYVVHAEMPRNIEAYQQESGRAGRDGLEAECCLIYSGRDAATWEFLISQSENEDNRIQSLAALRKMEAFCASPVCRHQLLVEHFGQKLESSNCGSCDVCLEEINVVADSLIVAQKILSSVYRQGQRFGADYTSLVLRGSRSRKVLKNEHEKLSTYGLLKDEPESVVRSWIDQLVAQGYLRRAGEHSTLELTAEGGQVLKGDVTPTLTRPKDSRSVVSQTDDWDGVDRGLFNALRQLRIEIAEERGVPPYVVFGDVTLRELAKFRPTDINSILRIYGIGQQKQEEFGAAFIECITDYCDEHDVPTDVVDSQRPATSKPARRKKRSAASGPYFELFDEDLSRDEVALQLDRALTTVNQYLTEYIRLRRIADPHAWIDAGTVERVHQAIADHGSRRLKPLFVALEETVSYDDIRIVVACQEVADQETA